MVDPTYLNIFVKYIVLYFISRNIQKPDQVFCCFPLDVVVSVLEVSRFEQDVRIFGDGCACWACSNRAWGACTCVFSDTARAHSEMSRSRITFLAHMIQQQSAFIQCIHDRPNISQHLFIIYRFLFYIRKHPETWSWCFFCCFPFGSCCVCQTQLREF